MVNKSLFFGRQSHVANSNRSWHDDRTGNIEGEMTDSKNAEPGSNKNAGGFFLAMGCILGVVVGSLLGQPSMGFIGGLLAGGLVAIAIWYFDRKNNG